MATAKILAIATVVIAVALFVVVVSPIFAIVSTAGLPRGSLQHRGAEVLVFHLDLKRERRRVSSMYRDVWVGMCGQVDRSPKIPASPWLRNTIKEKSEPRLRSIIDGPDVV